MANVMVSFTVSGREGQEQPDGLDGSFLDGVRSWVAKRNGRFDGEIRGGNIVPFIAFRFSLPVWGDEERAYVSRMLAEFAEGAFGDKTCIKFSFDHLIEASLALREKLLNVSRPDTLPKLNPIHLTEGEGEGKW